MKKEIGATPGWVNRDPEPEEMADLYDYVSREVGFITSILDDERLDDFSPTFHWSWEEYQLEHLSHGGWWAGNKCRQAGVSTSFSAKAFARGILTERNYTGIFVSYKKEEAVNKINYVKQFLDSLPPRFRKKILRDPLQLIEWQNANGTQARIISHAQRPIRGINGDVFLDELAFYQFADEIYTSALPAVGGARGTMDITSTPFGAGDKFYEVITDKHRYPLYKRQMIMWWHVMRYLKEPTIEFLVKAEFEAPKIKDLHDRIEMFGNETLKQQFMNADNDEHFMQEFEGHFVDAEAAFFTKDLIMRCMYPDVIVNDDYAPRADDFNIDIEDALSDFDFPIIQNNIGQDFKKYDTLEALYDAVRRAEITSNLIAGADLGMTHHSTDFTVLEEVVRPDGSTLQIERFSRNEQNWPLPEQEAYFSSIMDDGYIRRFFLDATGIGAHMGQALESRYGDSMINAIQLGGSSKKVENLMVNLRSRMENNGIALYYDRLTLDDIYSIKRIITDRKQVSFRADKNKRHHADRAFAIALASMAGTEWGQRPFEFKSTSDLDVGKIKRLRDKSTGLPDDVTRRSTMERLIGANLGLKSRMALLEMSDPGRFINIYDD